MSPIGGALSFVRWAPRRGLSTPDGPFFDRLFGQAKGSQPGGLFAQNLGFGLSFRRGVSALLLGPLIVEPVFRSQGIGEALVKRSLEAAKAAGWKLVILVGDHQPPAAVGGELKDGTVPIHVLSRDQDLIAPFISLGYSAGLAPKQLPPYQGMEEFLPRFLAAFDRSS